MSLPKPPPARHPCTVLVPERRCNDAPDTVFSLLPHHPACSCLLRSTPGTFLRVAASDKTEDPDISRMAHVTHGPRMARITHGRKGYQRMQNDELFDQPYQQSSTADQSPESSVGSPTVPLGGPPARYTAQANWPATFADVPPEKPRTPSLAWGWLPWASWRCWGRLFPSVVSSGSAAWCCLRSQAVFCFSPSGSASTAW